MSSLPGISEADVQVISSPPFVIVEGVPNIRYIGGYVSHSLGSSESSDPVVVKTSSIFRSGDPSRITARGQEQLRALKITKVFDMRDASEITSYGSKTFVIDGVQTDSAPVSGDKKYDPASLALRMQDFGDKEENAFEEMYSDILKNGAPAFSKIFLHIRDHPDEPCLVHCTAGKDRTGVFSALFLMLLGVSDEDIILDYTLTSIGLKPVLPKLLEQAFHVIYPKESGIAINSEARENAKDILRKMANANPGPMRATLKSIREKYGGAEGYLSNFNHWTDQTMLTQADIDKIRNNFLETRSTGVPV